MIPRLKAVKTALDKTNILILILKETSSLLR